MPSISKSKGQNEIHSMFLVPKKLYNSLLNTLQDDEDTKNELMGINQTESNNYIENAITFKKQQDLQQSISNNSVNRGMSTLPSNITQSPYVFTRDSNKPPSPLPSNVINGPPIFMRNSNIPPTLPPNNLSFQPNLGETASFSTVSSNNVNSSLYDISTPVGIGKKRPSSLDKDSTPTGARKKKPLKKSIYPLPNIPEAASTPLPPESPTENNKLSFITSTPFDPRTKKSSFKTSTPIRPKKLSFSNLSDTKKKKPLLDISEAASIPLPPASPKENEKLSFITSTPNPKTKKSSSFKTSTPIRSKKLSFTDSSPVKPIRKKPLGFKASTPVGPQLKRSLSISDSTPVGSKKNRSSSSSVSTRVEPEKLKSPTFGPSKHVKPKRKKSFAFGASKYVTPSSEKNKFEASTSVRPSFKASTPIDRSSTPIRRTSTPTRPSFKTSTPIRSKRKKPLSFGDSKYITPLSKRRKFSTSTTIIPKRTLSKAFGSSKRITPPSKWLRSLPSNSELRLLPSNSEFRNTPIAQALRERNPEGRFVCPQCGKKYVSVGKFGKHLLSVHENSMGVEDFNEVSLITESSQRGSEIETQRAKYRNTPIKEALKQRNARGRLVCPFKNCEKQYVSIEVLGKHLLVKHPNFIGVKDRNLIKSSIIPTNLFSGRYPRL